MAAVMKNLAAWEAGYGRSGGGWVASGWRIFFSKHPSEGK